MIKWNNISHSDSLLWDPKTKSFYPGVIEMFDEKAYESTKKYDNLRTILKKLNITEDR